MVASNSVFPAPEIEEGIVVHEAGVDTATAAELVRSAKPSAAWKRWPAEVASTRVLIAAGRLIAEGLPMYAAAASAIAGPLTDDVRGESQSQGG